MGWLRSQDLTGAHARGSSTFYVVTDIAPGPVAKRRQAWPAGYPTRRPSRSCTRSSWSWPSAATSSQRRARVAYLLEDWLPGYGDDHPVERAPDLSADADGVRHPGLGHCRLADLDPLLLTTHYAALLTVRKRRSEGLGAEDRYCHVGRRHALADAVLWRLLADNAPEGARPLLASASRPPHIRIHDPRHSHVAGLMQASAPPKIMS